MFCSYIKPSGHKFNQMAISGGEPLLNPEISEIVEILTKSNLAKRYTVLTNGTIEHNLKVEVFNSHKNERTQPNHTRLQGVAPIDVNLFGEKPIKQCFILHQCGLGYSRNGFYPCVISAAIGRIFGINGIRYWKDINDTNLTKLLWQTCRYCGYYLCDSLPEYRYPTTMMTDSWKKALEWYNNLPDDQK